MSKHSLGERVAGVKHCLGRDLWLRSASGPLPRFWCSRSFDGSGRFRGSTIHRQHFVSPPLDRFRFLVWLASSTMSSQSSLFSSFNLQQWPNLVNLPKTGFTFSHSGWMAGTEYRSYSRDTGPIRSKRQDVDADSAQRLTALALNLHQPGASVNNEVLRQEVQS